MACAASTRIRYPYLVKYQHHLLAQHQYYYIMKDMLIKDILCRYSYITLVNKYTQPSCSESTYNYAHSTMILSFTCDCGLSLSPCIGTPLPASRHFCLATITWYLHH